MKKKSLNTYNNFIILTDIGFNKRDYLRFNLKLLKKYFKVYIIDLTLIKSKKFYLEKKKYYFKLENYFLAKNLTNAKNEINKLILNKSETYCLDLSGNDKGFEKFKRDISKKGCKFVFFDFGLVPKIKLNLYEKIFKSLILIKQNKIDFLKKLISKLNYLTIKKNNIFKYEILINTGIMSDIYANKKIYSYSLDYLNYLKSSNLSKYKGKKYILFIDQNYPSHPGQKYRKKSKNINEEKYYKELKIFLNYMKKKFKTKILISAHPTNKSNYLKSKLNFCVSKGNTINLVKNASIVVTFTSTSVSFAVLYKKPIIFLTNEDINRSYDAFLPNSMSRSTNSICINISNDKYKKINIKNLIKVDKEKYNNYLNSYIKHPKSNNLNPFVKLIDYIN